MLGINSSLNHTRTMKAWENSFQVGIRDQLSFLMLLLGRKY